MRVFPSGIPLPVDRDLLVRLWEEVTEMPATDSPLAMSIISEALEGGGADDPANGGYAPIDEALRSIDQIAQDLAAFYRALALTGAGRPEGITLSTWGTSKPGERVRV